MIGSANQGRMEGPHEPHEAHEAHEAHIRFIFYTSMRVHEATFEFPKLLQINKIL